MLLRARWWWFGLADSFRPVHVAYRAVLRALHERYDMPRCFVTIFLCRLCGEWCGMVCSDICLLGCSFGHSFTLCAYDSCCFLLLRCGCTILVCEVVLNYVEVGDMARCVVLLRCAVVLWCPVALRVGNLRFALVLCICYVGVLCWHNR